MYLRFQDVEEMTKTPSAHGRGAAAAAAANYADEYVNDTAV